MRYQASARDDGVAVLTASMVKRSLSAGPKFFPSQVGAGKRVASQKTWFVAVPPRTQYCLPISSLTSAMSARSAGVKIEPAPVLLSAAAAAAAAHKSVNTMMLRIKVTGSRELQTR